MVKKLQRRRRKYFMDWPREIERESERERERKLPLHLIKQYAAKTWDSEGIASHSLTSALDRNERSTSHPSLSTPRECALMLIE
jgi:hypothetical protein